MDARLVSALAVFVSIAIAGLVLDFVGRFVTPRCPTITDIARYVGRHRFGGWLLFLTWAFVGWHLLAS